MTTFERGDVYHFALRLPNRVSDEPLYLTPLKYAVMIQGGADFHYESDISYIVASSFRGRPKSDYEVWCQGGIDGFEDDTVLDCRWVYTIPKWEIPEDAWRFKLSDEVMDDVSYALISGQQQRPSGKPRRVLPTLTQVKQ